MNSVYQATLDIRMLLEPIVGEINVKTYFSYYGLMKNKVMFALYKEGRFYLRKSKKYEKTLLKYCPITLKDSVVKIQAKSFHYIPPHILKNILAYEDWVLSVIAELSKKEEKDKPIRRLPNMNFHLELMLNRIGIYISHQLMNLGASRSFIYLVQEGTEVNKALLFKLAGAIQHKLFGYLTEKEKALLITETNALLNEIGSRKRL